MQFLYFAQSIYFDGSTYLKVSPLPVRCPAGRWGQTGMTVESLTFPSLLHRVCRIRAKEEIMISWEPILLERFLPVGIELMTT